MKRIKDNTLRAGASVARAQSRTTVPLCEDLNESGGEKKTGRRRGLFGLRCIRGAKYIRRQLSLQAEAALPSVADIKL